MTIIDIFYDMRHSKEIITGKYYIRQILLGQSRSHFKEITAHEAIVRKLKGLSVYKAHHTDKSWNKAALIKIS